MIGLANEEAKIVGVDRYCTYSPYLVEHIPLEMRIVISIQ